MQVFSFVARYSKQDICPDKCQKPRSNCLGFVLQGTPLPPFSLGSCYAFQSTGTRRRKQKAHVPMQEGITAAWWCISALFRKKRLPLEGKLATKLTDEVFRETNAMRSSDPQKLMLFTCPPHPASLTLRHLPLKGKAFFENHPSENASSEPLFITYSNCSAACFRSSRISRCCGQISSH